ncbi:hypothetical protein FGO68_gene10280 [Halteria grandinella]|uniref:Uncharacterized protein n=1 Tax=Halteria grandinella TaxID=5974 RepID=A0A8J8P4B6_HALGN|nr:hypothetical protein FGO68_gene10280 [Halteria grandinella]
MLKTLQDNHIMINQQATDVKREATPTKLDQSRSISQIKDKKIVSVVSQIIAKPQTPLLGDQVKAPVLNGKVKQQLHKSRPQTPQSIKQRQNFAQVKRVGATKGQKQGQQLQQSFVEPKSKVVIGVSDKENIEQIVKDVQRAKERVDSITRQTIDPRVLRERAKKKLLSLLGAVIMGYKVRRILKLNKQLFQIKKELSDLIKFIGILRNEIKESSGVHTKGKLVNNEMQVSQAKQLLVRSNKDLTQKRLIFHQTFWDIYNNPKWMKITNPANKGSQIGIYNIKNSEKSSRSTHLKSKSISHLKTRRKSALDQTSEKIHSLVKDQQNNNSILNQTATKMLEIDIVDLKPSKVSAQEKSPLRNKRSIEVNRSRELEISRVQEKVISQIPFTTKSKIEQPNAKKSRRATNKSCDFTKKVVPTKKSDEKKLETTQILMTTMPTEPMCIDQRQTTSMIDFRALTLTNSDAVQISRYQSQAYQPTVSNVRPRVSQDFSLMQVDRPSNPLLSCRSNTSNTTQQNHMEQLIDELKQTACSIESTRKQHKTMETLNAISGMLESLKINGVLQPISEEETTGPRVVKSSRSIGKTQTSVDKDAQLKARFDVRDNINQSIKIVPRQKPVKRIPFFD